MGNFFHATLANPLPSATIEKYNSLGSHTHPHTHIIYTRTRTIGDVGGALVRGLCVPTVAHPVDEVRRCSATTKTTVPGASSRLKV